MTVLLFPVNSFLFAGHQGSSQSDLCTNTGFRSFELLTCDSMATERVKPLPYRVQHGLLVEMRFTWIYVWVLIASVFLGLFNYKSASIAAKAWVFTHLSPHILLQVAWFYLPTVLILLDHHQ